MTCCCNYTFVYDILRSTFTFQRTFLLFSTVTMFRLLLFSIGQLFVVWLDNGTHIGRTGIAYFNSISIEYFVKYYPKLNIIWNMFCHFKFVLLTYEYIYNFVYNRRMQFPIGSVIMVYYRIVWFFWFFDFFYWFLLKSILFNMRISNFKTENKY